MLSEQILNSVTPWYLSLTELVSVANVAGLCVF